jgi:hypothetical protein
MKVVKARCESEELKMFRSLNLRMELTAKEANYFSHLVKGYEGECRFDRLVEQHLSDDWLAVNDLLLENNRIFQIDSRLLRYGMIFLNDVKNFEGDYYIKDGKWFTASGTEIDDPLDQLTRCESHLRRLLHHLGVSIPIVSHLVFVNPEFYLYQAPLNLPIVFPTQLKRFMNQLETTPGKLNNHYYHLAQKLVSLNIENPPVRHIPSYSYGQLKKGPACRCGRSFMKIFNQETLVCPDCGCMESVESAVLRNIGELKMLFPDLKITTFAVYDWCGMVFSKKKIWRILKKNFELRSNGRATYYAIRGD